MADRPRIKFDFDLSDGRCFGCGENNAVGLKLKFQKEGNIVRAEFMPGDIYQGWLGILHGGIIASALDEGMGWATKFAGLNCVTAGLRVKFKRPIAIGERLLITALIALRRSRYVETEAKITLADGTLLAEGFGTHAIIEAAEKKS